MRKLVLLLPALLFLFTGQLLAQDRTVSGRVMDANGKPLNGASVIVKGTQLGTATNGDGDFSLSVPQSARALIITSVGLLEQEVSIVNKSTVTVSMKSDVSNLEGVIVVGYGTQRKRELTGSVSKIAASELQNLPIQGPDQALRGRAAGVTVTQSSGTPGASININIRGAGSISASNQPLYVIDGIPINIGSYSQIAVGGQTLNALADINPNEIESYEVLKDAAAASIYGSRAANGVVIITTKRGANRKTKVGLSAYFGNQNAWKRADVLSGPEYVGLVQEAVVNRFGNVLPSALGLVGLDNAPSTYGTTNWQDEIMRSAPVQGYDLNVSGGNDKTKFYMSGSYFDQKGIILGSGFKRYNMRMNLDNTVTSKLKISTGIALSRSVSTRIQNDNNINGVLSSALLLGTYIPKFNPDGTYGRDANASIENPIAAALEPTFDVKNNRILANLSADYQMLPWLSLKTVFGADYLTFREWQFLPTTTNTGAGVKGDGREAYNQEINLTNENILTARKKFGKHDFTFTGVASYQESKQESIFAQAQNFPGNSIRRLVAGSVRVAATSNSSNYGLIGYLGRLNYGFDGKYLFSASVRRDGVSRFGATRRWGTFPAVSAAWRISEEKFLKNSSFISDLKIRGSWGKAGNSSIGDFAALPLVGGGANYAQSAGLNPTQLGNPDLGWEESEQKDLGVEIGLFRGRININVDVYNRTTNALLLARPLVGSSGFTTINENIGSMENKGIELTLNTVNLKGGDLQWNTSFNITFPTNRVKKLAGAPFAAGFASWVEEGQELGSFRGFVVKGIFQTAAQIAAAPLHSAATRPGDIEFADLNGDNRITSDDQRIIGSAVPKYFGGMTNNISFKNFELTAFVQFVQGNEIYNNTRAFSEGMNSIFGQTAGTRDRWVPGKTDAVLPRAVFGDPSNNRRVSNRWVEDGSFVRLKNVVLSYNMPKQILDRLSLAGLKIFIQGENLFTWTKYSGLDPEVSTFSITNTAPGTDFLTFPQSRNITFGINLSF